MTMHTHSWPHHDIKTDFMTADYVVVLKRYSLPEPRFGVHTLNISDEGRRFPFQLHVLGLYSEQTAQQMREYLAREMYTNPVKEGDLDWHSVMRYIGDQVIPIEWKTQWSEGDPEVIGRVEVYSVISA